jgi:hypothetical protein
MSSPDPSQDTTGAATALRRIAAATGHTVNIDNLVAAAAHDPAAIVTWIAAAADYAAACYSTVVLREVITLLQDTIAAYTPDAVGFPLGLLSEAVRQRATMASRQTTVLLAFRRISRALDPDLVHPAAAASDDDASTREMPH